MFGRPPHQSSVGANCVRPPLNSLISLATFLFDTIGADENRLRKLRRNRKRLPSSQKRNADWGISPPAGGDRRFAVGARKTFEKVLSKLLHRMRCKNDRLLSQSIQATPKMSKKTSKKLLQIFKNLFTNQFCCDIISVNDVNSVLGSKAVLHRSSPTVY